MSLIFVAEMVSAILPFFSYMGSFSEICKNFLNFENCKKTIRIKISVFKKQTVWSLKVEHHSFGEIFPACLEGGI